MTEGKIEHEMYEQVSRFGKGEWSSSILLASIFLVKFYQLRLSAENVRSLEKEKV